MYTISLLGKFFGVSRSTLLYYDSIGLFTPSVRSEAGSELDYYLSTGRMAGA